jgi:hypothetical protein
VIVVDTNVLAYLYLQGAHTRRAEALLARGPRRYGGAATSAASSPAACDAAR